MKSVIFDLDGTLVDSQSLQFLAYKMAFEEKGFNLTWEDWKEYWVNSSTDAFKWKEIKNWDYDVYEIRERKKDIYEALVKKDLKVKPGAIELVEDLKRSGFNLAVASASRIESVRLVVDVLFKGLFDVLQSDTGLKRGKPYPDVFLITMEKMATSPMETVIIEDSPIGYKAAVASGAKCIICPDKTVSPDFDFCEADKVVFSLEELTVKDLLELFGG